MVLCSVLVQLWLCCLVVCFLYLETIVVTLSLPCEMLPRVPSWHRRSMSCFWVLLVCCQRTPKSRWDPLSLLSGTALIVPASGEHLPQKKVCQLLVPVISSLVHATGTQFYFVKLLARCDVRYKGGLSWLKVWLSWSALTSSFIAGCQYHMVNLITAREVLTAPNEMICVGSALSGCSSASSVMPTVTDCEK